MNNRQKAKHFKRKYEELKNAPIIVRNFISQDNYQITSVRAGRCYSLRDVIEMPDGAVKEEMLNVMKPELLKVMQIESYPMPETLQFGVKASLYIAERK